MAATLQRLSQELSACCKALQLQLQEPTLSPARAPPQVHGAVALPTLQDALRLHGEVLGVLSIMQQQAAVMAPDPQHEIDLRTTEQDGGSEELEEQQALAARRERVFGQALQALHTVATSMRSVLDDVSEGMPQNNGYVPTLGEIVMLGHHVRYTTFASMGLYSGEPAPQKPHFDASTLWEHHGSEQVRLARQAEAVPATDPAAAAAVQMFLEGLLQAGWAPDQGIPDYMLEGLSMIAPGALSILQHMVEARFGLQLGAPGPPGAPPITAPQTGDPQALTAQQQRPVQHQPQSQAAKLASNLFLDDDDDDDDDFSDDDDDGDESDDDD